MAYRFNSSRGGVTCDICNVLIDQDLSYKQYGELYRVGKKEEDNDLCMKCRIDIKLAKKPADSE